MAVQGKLVPQDPNDEPASVLLERIRKEKEQLIKEGKIKKEKNPSYIFRGADNLPYEKVGDKVHLLDTPFDIPESWEWIRFKDLVDYSMGKTPPRKETEYWSNGALPWVSIADLVADGTVTTTKECVNSFAAENTFKGKISKAGTLLMSFKLTVGKVSVLGIDAFHNEAIISIYPFVDPDKITTMFLFATLPLLSQSGDTKLAIKGNTLNSDSLDALLIPLPPIMEQKRIFDKLHELTTPLLDYGAAAQKVTDLNANFPEALKKSILQEAVQGKLVPQDPSDEPAEALLERIRAEKQRLIKEGKIKKDKRESVIFRRDNSHYEKRGSEEVCIDEYLPFELPNNWQWERLINLYNFIDYRGSTPTKIDTGVPLITAKNVKKGYIDYKIRDYISEEEYCTRQSRGISQRGDILFTTEAPLGNVALADLDQFSAGQRLITLQQYTTYPLINNNLVMYFMLSDCFQSQLIEQSTGTTVKGIKADKLKQLWIPVPPLQEQVRILAQLRKVLEACIAL